MAFHINPTTGRPNQCQATKRCPFGGPSAHFATKAEAQAHFETQMRGETLPASAKRQALGFPAPSLYRLRPQSAGYIVDYEYDSYDCSDYASCSESGDYCRDKVYEGLRIESVMADEVYAYAQGWIGSNTLPQDLKNRLDARMGEWTDPGNWEAYGEQGYYGEEVTVEAPRALDDAIKDWYYDQPGAVDEDEVLPYLRGLGFDTTGKSPVEAVKAYLAAENGGRLPRDAQAAKIVEVHSVSLKRIAPPDPARYAGTIAVEPKPEPLAGTKKEFAGVLVETNAKGYASAPRWGSYAPALADLKLLDGYRRVKHLKTATARTKATFLVLRK